MNSRDVIYAEYEEIKKKWERIKFQIRIQFIILN